MDAVSDICRVRPDGLSRQAVTELDREAGSQRDRSIQGHPADL